MQTTPLMVPSFPLDLAFVISIISQSTQNQNSVLGDQNLKTPKGGNLGSKTLRETILVQTHFTTCQMGQGLPQIPLFPKLSIQTSNG